MVDDDYMIGNVSVKSIRNKNEKRVRAMIPDILRDYPNYHPQDLDIQDIYALALNKLPARYVQKGTISLKEPVTDDQIDQAIRDAIDQVMTNPSHG